MGDAGEGLIDADSRIQERMEELERERTRGRVHAERDPVRPVPEQRLLGDAHIAEAELGDQPAAERAALRGDLGAGAGRARAFSPDLDRAGPARMTARLSE